MANSCISFNSRSHDDTCPTCLAKNRKLHLLHDQHITLLNALDIFINTNKKHKGRVLCWECYAAVKNILRFQHTAKLAQNILYLGNRELLLAADLSRLRNNNYKRTLNICKRSGTEHDFEEVEKNLLPAQKHLPPAQKELLPAHEDSHSLLTTTENEVENVDKRNAQNGSANNKITVRLNKESLVKINKSPRPLYIVVNRTKATKTNTDKTTVRHVINSKEALRISGDSSFSVNSMSDNSNKTLSNLKICYSADDANDIEVQKEESCLLNNERNIHNNSDDCTELLVKESDEKLDNIDKETTYQSFKEQYIIKDLTSTHMKNKLAEDKLNQNNSSVKESKTSLYDDEESDDIEKKITQERFKDQNLTKDPPNVVKKAEKTPNKKNNKHIESDKKMGNENTFERIISWGFKSQNTGNVPEQAYIQENVIEKKFVDENVVSSDQDSGWRQNLKLTSETMKPKVNVSMNVGENKSGDGDEAPKHTYTLHDYVGHYPISKDYKSNVITEEDSSSHTEHKIILQDQYEFKQEKSKKGNDSQILRRFLMSGNDKKDNIPDSTEFSYLSVKSNIDIFTSNEHDNIVTKIIEIPKHGQENELLQIPSPSQKPLEMLPDNLKTCKSHSEENIKKITFTDCGNTNHGKELCCDSYHEKHSNNMTKCLIVDTKNVTLNFDLNDHLLQSNQDGQLITQPVQSTDKMNNANTKITPDVPCQKDVSCTKIKRRLVTNRIAADHLPVPKEHALKVPLNSKSAAPTDFNNVDMHLELLCFRERFWLEHGYAIMSYSRQKGYLKEKRNLRSTLRNQNVIKLKETDTNNSPIHENNGNRFDSSIDLNGKEISNQTARNCAHKNKYRILRAYDQPQRNSNNSLTTSTVISEYKPPNVTDTVKNAASSDMQTNNLKLFPDSNIIGTSWDSMSSKENLDLISAINNNEQDLNEDVNLKSNFDFTKAIGKICHEEIDIKSEPLDTDSISTISAPEIYQYDIKNELNYNSTEDALFENTNVEQNMPDAFNDRTTTTDCYEPYINEKTNPAHRLDETEDNKNISNKSETNLRNISCSHSHFDYDVPIEPAENQIKSILSNLEMEIKDEIKVPKDDLLVPVFSVDWKDEKYSNVNSIVIKRIYRKNKLKPIIIEQNKESQVQSIKQNRKRKASDLSKCNMTEKLSNTRSNNSLNFIPLLKSIKKENVKEFVTKKDINDKLKLRNTDSKKGIKSQKQCNSNKSAKQNSRFLLKRTCKRAIEENVIEKRNHKRFKDCYKPNQPYVANNKNATNRNTTTLTDFIENNREITLDEVESNLSDDDIFLNKLKMDLNYTAECDSQNELTNDDKTNALLNLPEYMETTTCNTEINIKNTMTNSITEQEISSNHEEDYSIQSEELKSTKNNCNLNTQTNKIERRKSNSKLLDDTQTNEKTRSKSNLKTDDVTQTNQNIKTQSYSKTVNDIQSNENVGTSNLKATDDTHTNKDILIKSNSKMVNIRKGSKKKNKKKGAKRKNDIQRLY